VDNNGDALRIWLSKSDFPFFKNPSSRPNNGFSMWPARMSMKIRGAGRWIGTKGDRGGEFSLRESSIPALEDIGVWQLPNFWNLNLSIFGNGHSQKLQFMEAPFWHRDQTMVLGQVDIGIKRVQKHNFLIWGSLSIYHITMHNTTQLQQMKWIQTFCDSPSGDWFLCRLNENLLRVQSLLLGGH